MEKQSTTGSGLEVQSLGEKENLGANPDKKYRVLVPRWKTNRHEFVELDLVVQFAPMVYWKK